MAKKTTHFLIMPEFHYYLKKYKLLLWKYQLYQQFQDLEIQLPRGKTEKINRYFLIFVKVFASLNIKTIYLRFKI
jgi:hypothetical protein